MKNYLRFLSPVMLLLMAVMFGGGKILAQTSEKFDFVGWSFTTDTWPSDYLPHTVSGNVVDVVFSNANKQGQTITDCPVTKGKPITVSLKDPKSYNITGVKLLLKKWGTKKQTVTLNVSANGKDFTSTSEKSSKFELNASSLTAKALQFTFSTDNQVGVQSIEIFYEKDDGKTQTTLSFPTPSYTYEVGHDGGTVTIEDNIAVLKDKDGKEISDATGKITYSVVPEDVAFCDKDNPSTIWVDTSKEGTATVTATFDAAGTDEKYSTSTATYTIKVTKRQTTLSFGETYDGKTINVNLGDEFTAPTATLTPNIEGATIKYSSNKPTVATVDETTGAVTIVGAGTTVITADFVGDDTYGASTASYTINVVKPVTVEDGVFDFAGDFDYGSGVTKTSNGSFYITTNKTWTAGNVKMLTSGKYRWWEKTNGLRFYGGSFTLSVPDGYVITNVTLSGNRTFDVDCGKYSKTTGKWTGSASSIVFTTSTTGKDLNSITVKYAETLTTSARGYATYSADYAVNYSELGLTAYTLTVDETNKTVTAKEFTGVVSAGGAVLVKGDVSKAYTLTPATTEGDATSFVTDLQTGATTANGTQYGFTSKSGTPAFAQVKSGQEIPAKKGYIVLNGASAAKYSICFDDEATGIHTIEAASAANDAMYNLAGQRVDKAYKGIVIVNGKKYLNK